MDWERQTLRWAEQVVGDIKISQVKDLWHVLKSGQLLCRLVDHIKPGFLDKSWDLSSVGDMDRMHWYSDALWRIGVPSNELFSPVVVMKRRDVARIIRSMAVLGHIACSLGYKGPRPPSLPIQAVTQPVSVGSSPAPAAGKHDPPARTFLLTQAIEERQPDKTKGVILNQPSSTNEDSFVWQIKVAQLEAEKHELENTNRKLEEEVAALRSRERLRLQPSTASATASPSLFAGKKKDDPSPLEAELSRQLRDTEARLEVANREVEKLLSQNLSLCAQLEELRHTEPYSALERRLGRSEVEAGGLREVVDRQNAAIAASSTALSTATAQADEWRTKWMAMQDSKDSAKESQMMRLAQSSHRLLLDARQTEKQEILASLLGDLELLTEDSVHGPHSARPSVDFRGGSPVGLGPGSADGKGGGRTAVSTGTRTATGTGGVPERSPGIMRNLTESKGEDADDGVAAVAAAMADLGIDFGGSLPRPSSTGAMLFSPARSPERQFPARTATGSPNNDFPDMSTLHSLGETRAAVAEWLAREEDVYFTSSPQSSIASSRETRKTTKEERKLSISSELLSAQSQIVQAAEAAQAAQKAAVLAQTSKLQAELDSVVAKEKETRTQLDLKHLVVISLLARLNQLRATASLSSGSGQGPASPSPSGISIALGLPHSGSGLQLPLPSPGGSGVESGSSSAGSGPAWSSFAAGLYSVELVPSQALEEARGVLPRTKSSAAMEDNSEGPAPFRIDRGLCFHPEAALNISPQSIIKAAQQLRGLLRGQQVAPSKGPNSPLTDQPADVDAVQSLFDSDSGRRVFVSLLLRALSAYRPGLAGTQLSPQRSSSSPALDKSRAISSPSSPLPPFIQPTLTTPWVILNENHFATALFLMNSCLRHCQGDQSQDFLTTVRTMEAVGRIAGIQRTRTGQSEVKSILEFVRAFVRDLPSAFWEEYLEWRMVECRSQNIASTSGGTPTGVRSVPHSPLSESTLYKPTSFVGEMRKRFSHTPAKPVKDALPTQWPLRTLLQVSFDMYWWGVELSEVRRFVEEKQQAADIEGIDAAQFRLVLESISQFPSLFPEHKTSHPPVRLPLSPRGGLNSTAGAVPTTPKPRQQMRRPASFGTNSDTIAMLSRSPSVHLGTWLADDGPLTNG